jgi:hypothetical protein
MPRGPRGEKRPADVIGTAVMVAKIATGEIVDNPRLDSSASALGRKGGQARAAKLSAKKRKEIAREALPSFGRTDEYNPLVVIGKTKPIFLNLSNGLKNWRTAQAATGKAHGSYLWDRTEKRCRIQEGCRTQSRLTAISINQCPKDRLSRRTTRLPRYLAMSTAGISFRLA